MSYGGCHYDYRPAYGRIVRTLFERCEWGHTLEARSANDRMICDRYPRVRGTDGRMRHAETQLTRDVPSTQHALHRQRLAQTGGTPWQQTRDARHRAADLLRLAQCQRAYRCVWLILHLDGAKQRDSSPGRPQPEIERRPGELQRRFQHAKRAHPYKINSTFWT